MSLDTQYPIKAKIQYRFCRLYNLFCMTQKEITTVETLVCYFNQFWWLYNNKYSVRFLSDKYKFAKLEYIRENPVFVVLKFMKK